VWGTAGAGAVAGWGTAVVGVGRGGAVVVVMGGVGSALDPLGTKSRSAPRGGVASKYVLIAAVDPGFPFFIGAPVTGGAKM
jgi:hypothetical protein